jgi:hypothetical protein
MHVLMLKANWKCEIIRLETGCQCDVVALFGEYRDPVLFLVEVLTRRVAITRLRGIDQTVACRYRQVT